MIVNKENLEISFQMFKALFYESLVEATPQYKEIATIAPLTSGKVGKFGWLGDIPQVEEFIGPRAVKQLRQFNYTIEDKKWHSSIAVGLDELEDDNWGMIKPRIGDLADAGELWKDDLVFSLLKNGFTALCFDGQYFFDTDHLSGESGSQSNKGTTAYSLPAVRDTVALMMSFKTDTGRFIRAVPDTVVVPPSLYLQAVADLESPVVIVADTTIRGSNNPLLKLKMKAMTDPILTDSNDWFVLCTKRRVKPLIFQPRVEPTFVAADDPRSQKVFEEDEVQYGIRMRCNAGYGLWQFAFGHVVSG